MYRKCLVWCNDCIRLLQYSCTFFIIHSNHSWFVVEFYALESNPEKSCVRIRIYEGNIYNRICYYQYVRFTHASGNTGNFCSVFTDMRMVYHQWMGQFPMQRERAAALIAGSALVAGVIDADKIVVKTVDEALGVPRPEVNAEAVDTVRYILRTFATPDLVDSPAIQQEATLIESQVRCVLESIFALSGDAFWESVYRAFQLGYLDVPFSPHADNANRLVTMRDGNRSIRIVDPGAMPISVADAAAERKLLESRVDRCEKTYRQMLADITLMV